MDFGFEEQEMNKEEFFNWLKFVVFSQNPPKWKIEQIQEKIVKIIK